MHADPGFRGVSLIGARLLIMSTTAKELYHHDRPAHVPDVNLANFP